MWQHESGKNYHTTTKTTNHIFKWESAVPKNPALGASAAGTAGLQIHGASETQGPLTHTSDSDPGPGPCVRPRVTSQKPRWRNAATAHTRQNTFNGLALKTHLNDERKPRPYLFHIVPMLLFGNGNVFVHWKTRQEASEQPRAERSLWALDSRAAWACFRPPGTR